MKNSALHSICATAVFVVAGAVSAADYPDRPIRFITPAQPGGTTDILARMTGSKLTESLKQQVIVDNRASANGVIAGDLTAKAPPDGYTIFMAYHQHTINSALLPKLPYHAVNDFTPITQLTAAGVILLVHPSTPVHNFREFMEWTKSYKGPLNYGSAGHGSGGHLAAELYNMMAGVKAQHIPYKGAAPALIDLTGGHYQFTFAGMLASQPFIKSGKLRPIAVTSPKRAPGLENIPTVAESGLPGFEVLGWYGVLAPAKLPKPILTRLHTEFVKIIKQPEAQQRILSEGAEPVGSAPEEFRKFMLADLAKWEKVVKQSGAKAD